MDLTVHSQMVDLYEPSLMFAVPRLAIVYGLLISPWGPLNVDKSSSGMMWAQSVFETIILFTMLEKYES